MPETYASLKMNADDIIAQIQALPAEEEGREWALELGTPQGKQVRYSETVSPLWKILEGISALQGGEMPFRYVGVLRLPEGPRFSRTFDGQQVFPFGNLGQIHEALEVERQIQRARDGLTVEEKRQKLRIF